jgi:hypothetical protein
LKIIKLATAIAIIAGGVTAASAGPVDRETGPNLVTNGGFEATDTVAGSGWTISGAFQSEGFDYSIDTSPADAHSGNNSFAGGAIGDLGFLSQTIATTAGMTYNIHFSLANLSGFADGTAAEVVWNGQVVFSTTDVLGFGYQDFVIDPVATSALTTLSFGLRDDSFFLNLDDISVRAVPEPTTVALLFGGLGAVVALSRRRRKVD